MPPIVPPRRRPAVLGTVALAWLATALVAAMPAAGGGDPEARPTTTATATATVTTAAAAAATGPDDCSGGVIYDSGEVTTGYGFVPSATHGIYVQEFAVDDFTRRELDTVCVCWLRTRGEDHQVPFQVQLYEDVGGRPAEEPYYVRWATATDVPTSVAEAGRFYPVDVGGARIPPSGIFYIGVRWNPSRASFAFVCTDNTASVAKRQAWFREDRQPAWASVWTAKDPIFLPHRAIGVRARALPPGAPTPARPAASATSRLD